MQWRGRRGSSNVDDRRGISGGGIAAGGGIAGVIIYLIYTFLSGGNVDPSQMIFGIKYMLIKDKAILNLL